MTSLGSSIVNTARDLIARAINLIQDPLGMSHFDVVIDDLGMGQLPILGESPIEQAASLLGRAHSVLIFMGSGLSEESGLSTFRDKGTGLYQEDLVRVTHAQTFEENAQWQLHWHAKWLDKVHAARPNAAHYAMARMAQRPRVTLATQNVDLLLERALEQQRTQPPVYHLHGRLDQTRCHDNGCDLSSYADVDWRKSQPCPICGGRLRPDVVWFGEQLPSAMMAKTSEAALSAEVCLLVGTSGLVYPAATLPELAKRSGARLIEINPHATSLSEHCDVIIRARASGALEEIEALLALGAQPSNASQMPT